MFTQDDGVRGNAIKVAYMLLRDKRRAGRDRKHYHVTPVLELTMSNRRVRGTRAQCKAGCHGCKWLFSFC